MAKYNFQSFSLVVIVILLLSQKSATLAQGKHIDLLNTYFDQTSCALQNSVILHKLIIACIINRIRYGFAKIFG